MNQANSKMTRWIALNHGSFRLIATALPSSKKYLALAFSGSESLLIQQQEGLKSLGFFQTKSGHWLRENLKIKTTDLSPIFPNVKPQDMPVRDVMLMLDPEYHWIKKDLYATQSLGVNHLGWTVIQGEDGRFALDGEKRITSLSDAEQLIVKNDLQSLSECADAFVLEMMGGQSKRYSDLVEFGSLITGEPTETIQQLPIMRQIQEEVESALVRSIQQQIKAQGGIDNIVYQSARTLSDRQPEFKSRTSQSVSLQQYSTTLPLAVSVQRILGHIHGASILEPTVGNGVLLSGLSGSTRVGCDLDENRVLRAKKNFPDVQIFQGDATQVNFSSFNNNQKFDAVIANPPFGGLDKKVTWHGLAVQRLDQLIVLRSLESRKDDGVGVYIIGADSYLDSREGQVRGGSRYFFNWLSDHYQTDVVEVDGALFAKQGATFPFRIVVVGKKGPGDEIPDQIETLKNSNDVWQWCNEMRQKHGLSLDEPLENISDFTIQDIETILANGGRMRHGDMEYWIGRTQHGYAFNEFNDMTGNTVVSPVGRLKDVMQDAIHKLSDFADKAVRVSDLVAEQQDIPASLLLSEHQTMAMNPTLSVKPFRTDGPARPWFTQSHPGDLAGSLLKIDGRRTGTDAAVQEFYLYKSALNAGYKPAAYRVSGLNQVYVLVKNGEFLTRHGINQLFAEQQKNSVTTSLTDFKPELAPQLEPEPAPNDRATAIIDVIKTPDPDAQITLEQVRELLQSFTTVEGRVSFHKKTFTDMTSQLRECWAVLEKNAAQVTDEERWLFARSAASFVARPLQDSDQTSASQSERLWGVDRGINKGGWFPVLIEDGGEEWTTNKHILIKGQIPFDYKSLRPSKRNRAQIENFIHNGIRTNVGAVFQRLVLETAYPVSQLAIRDIPINSELPAFFYIGSEHGDGVALGIELDLYRQMLTAYPEAKPYFTQPVLETNPVVFKQGNEIVGLVSPINGSLHSIKELDAWLAWSKQQNLSILADPSQVKNIVKAKVDPNTEKKAEPQLSALVVDSNINFSSVGFDGARDWRFRGTQITFMDGNNVIQRGSIVSNLNNQGTLLSVTGQDAINHEIEVSSIKSIDRLVDNQQYLLTGDNPPAIKLSELKAGTLLAVSDGSAMPPARNKRQLESWRGKNFIAPVYSVDPERNLLCVDSFGSGVIIQQFDLNYTNLDFHALGVPQSETLIKEIGSESIQVTTSSQEEKKSLPADWLVELTQDPFYREAGDSWEILSSTAQAAGLTPKVTGKNEAENYYSISYFEPDGSISKASSRIYTGGQAKSFINGEEMPRLLATREPDWQRDALNEAIRLNVALKKEAKSKALPGQIKASTAVENDYQMPYQAKSQVAEPSSMIPRNMGTPIRQVLDRIETEYGDIDHYVGDKLQWSFDELADALSPEQVDAVALGIYAIENDRALLEGDQTGLGKGRVMAAMARYNVLHGRKVIFITETPTLFTDFWRDVRDINSADLFSPMIVNDGVAMFDPVTGKKLIDATPKAVIQRAIKNDEIPAEYNLVLATYSQFNRTAESSPKSRWIVSAARNAALNLDESHNAAGASSNTGTNIRAAIEYADAVVYSSATSMKNASNVLIYSKLFPGSVDLGSLPETLSAGGEVLQEVLSGMLAQDGVFIRREHDLSGLQFRTAVSKQEARNREFSDKLADILELMNYLSGDIKSLVNDRNKDIEKMLESIPESERAGNRMGASSVNFGSRLFALYRQFLMAIKTDLAVEQTLDALNNGQKPVIVLENTMETLLRETLLSQDVTLSDLDEVSVEQSLNGPQLLGEGLSFKDVLRRTLNRISYYVETDRYGSARKVAIESESALDLMDRISSLIDEFPELPISPLDDIRRQIEAAGFKCGELSGRKLRIEQNEEGQFFASNIQERPRAQLVREFNAGETDAVILTNAGSTGISLHSSKTFADQRQRRLIELQSAADVNRRVQFFGRVNRKGQINLPIIETLSSGLIGEARPIAMQNAKLRKLSANTTANQDNAALDRSVPDFINSIGNAVAKRYLESAPSIALRLDIDIESETEDPVHFIQKLTSRLVMLKVDEQEMIYAALTDEYERLIRELDAKGENPLKSQELDVKAEVVSSAIYEAGDPNSNSAFSLPVYIKEIKYNEQINPMRTADVNVRMTDGLNLLEGHPLNGGEQDAQSFILEIKSYLIKNRNIYLKQSLSKRFDSLEHALSDKDSNAAKTMLDRLQFIDRLLDGINVGSVVRYTNDMNEEAIGVVTRVSIPMSLDKLSYTGSYSMNIAVPGKQSTELRTFYSLQADPQFQVMSQQLQSGILRSFDTAQRGTVERRRLILDGNLFKAAQIAAKNDLGNSVIYTDANGNRLRGVILRKDLKIDHLNRLPVRIEQPSMARQLIEANPRLRLSTSVSDVIDRTKELVISFAPDSKLVEIFVPGTKSRGGAYFNDESLLKVTGQFSGNQGGMIAKFSIDKLDSAMKVIYSKGVSIYAPSSARDEINKLTSQLYDNKSCIENDEYNRMKVNV